MHKASIGRIVHQPVRLSANPFLTLFDATAQCITMTGPRHEKAKDHAEKSNRFDIKSAFQSLSEQIVIGIIVSGLVAGFFCAALYKEGVVKIDAAEGRILKSNGIIHGDIQQIRTMLGVIKSQQDKILQAQAEAPSSQWASLAPELERKLIDLSKRQLQTLGEAFLQQANRMEEQPAAAAATVAAAESQQQQVSKMKEFIRKNGQLISGILKDMNELDDRD